MNTTSDAQRFAFIGEALCLDFANTVDWHASERPGERLFSYEDLICWGKEASLINAIEADELLEEAQSEPEKAVETLMRARALREAIYRIFVVISSGGRPQADDLDLINAVLAGSLFTLRLVLRDGQYRCQWLCAKEQRILGEVARSAVDLLTSKELERVKQCEGDHGCGWLFMDMTKNHTRRWCDMESCGSRAKAKRYYRRKQQALSYRSSERS